MIEIQHLSKSFGKEVILKDISLAIPEGTTICIVGRSGSGKSVLIKHILGLLSPDEGEIFIENQPISTFERSDWESFMENVGVVFQSAALFDSLSVRENIGLRLYEERKFEEIEIREKVIYALQQVQLSPEIIDKYPAELSGGMQKRVGIARAIIHEPSYLFYDEPTTGLDPIGSAAIDDLIELLAPARTSIIVTHDMHSVQKLADQVLMIHNHRLWFYGAKSDFFLSKDAIIESFLQRGNYSA